MEAQVGTEYHSLNNGSTYPEITMPASMQAAAASSHVWISASNSSARCSCWPAFFVRADGIVTGRLNRHKAGVVISMLEIRPYKEIDETQVIQIWTECGLIVPWNDPKADIQRKLAVQRHLFLVGCADGTVIATIMAGYEGHRGWINYLAVKPNYQGTGIGKLMLEKAERLLKAEGCPKINLQVRSSNEKVIKFYEKIGYKADDVVSLGKRIQEN